MDLLIAHDRGHWDISDRGSPWPGAYMPTLQQKTHQNFHAEHSQPVPRDLQQQGSSLGFTPSSPRSTLNDKTYMGLPSTFNRSMALMGPEALNASRPEFQQESQRSLFHDTSSPGTLEPDATINLRSDGQDILSGPRAPLKRKRERKPRKCGLKLPEWGQYKAEIQRLYMDENRPISETMSIITAKSILRHSNKLWKEQLSEWGMTKNMPKSTTRWIIWNERKRKLQNKEPAKYTVAGQVIDLADIQKKAKRAKIEIDSDSDVFVETPKNLKYGTPDPMASQLAPARHLESPGPLAAKIRDAYEMNKLRDWLRLWENDDLLDGAFDLAKSYARENNMADADTIILWLGREYIRKWGIESEESAAHFCRVIELFHELSKPNNAIQLLKGALGAARCTQEQGAAETERSFAGIKTQCFSYLSRDTSENLDAINAASATPLDFEKESSEVRILLGKVKRSVAISKVTEAEHDLLEVIQRCNKQGEGLALLHFDACCLLVHVYCSKTCGFSECLDRVHSAREKAVEAFRWLMKREEDDPYFFRLALSLAYSFVKGNWKFWIFKAQEMVRSIEQSVVLLNQKKNRKYISICVILASYHHLMRSSIDAKKCLEKGVALSRKLHSRNCQVVTMIEKTLEKYNPNRHLPTGMDFRIEGESWGFDRGVCDCDDPSPRN